MRRARRVLSPYLDGVGTEEREDLLIVSHLTDAEKAGATSISVGDGSGMGGQFLLGAGWNRAPARWVSDAIGDWFLGRHPDLPAIRLTGRDRGAMGWMLGYPISEAGTLLADGESLRVPAPALESTEALEAFIYSFGGRFAAVLLDDHPRLYLDPCGSLSAVYCTHQHLVASTPNLIPYEGHTRDRAELARAIGIPHTNGMYPLGLTPRYGIERILPNHYLDLSSWETIRHWPKQPLTYLVPVEEAVVEIADIVKRQIAAVVAASPTYLPLTAGRDSRMLLACAKGVADRLELLTVELGNQPSAVDCKTSRRIAERFGLKHRVLPMERATEADLQEWMFRIGYSTGEVTGWQCATTWKRLPGGRAMLGGNVGELARGYYWREDDTETTVIMPERLLDICRCPPHDVALARVRAWLETVPATDALQLLDMQYLEQRIGCWAGVWPYAACDYAFEIFPVCHRRVIELMLTLPASYRRSGQLPWDIIAREWPDLLKWPFNARPRIERLWARTRRVVKGA